MTPNSQTLVSNAAMIGLAVPAFNIPHLPMMEPVIRAVVEEDAFALIETARLEWYKFEAKSAAAVAKAYYQYANADHVRLHLDHVPVIDEDDIRVDYLPIIREALDLGFQSVMIDGSRLSLEENSAATGAVVEIAHAVGIPVEAELGAVLGHEAGPPPPYEALFTSGRGFTDVAEAAHFVQKSGCDWLSVAAGSIHGAVSGALKDQKKVEARLNIEHIRKIRAATGVPLVLHGGSGVQRSYLLEAIRHGMVKVNIGTEIRQAYEQAWRKRGRIVEGQEACYEHTRWLLREYFGLTATRAQIFEFEKQI